MTDPDPADPFPAGRPQPLAPGVARLLAPNPSPMTFRGTNTYLVGTAELAVIDPGPDDPAHLDAILSAAAGRRISHICVTHAHRDHSALAPALAARTGAPILAFGDATAGRSAAMTALAETGLTSGGEGVDSGFRPDVTLADGACIAGADWRLTALHTPGHFGNHLCFALGATLFTGDLVMGWASSLVSPPDGDLGDYMASLARLAARPWSRFLPGHGAPILTPHARLAWLAGHRNARTAQILTALRPGPATPEEIATRLYTDLDPRLLPAARRNALAHLVELTRQSQVTRMTEASGSPVFSLL